MIHSEEGSVKWSGSRMEVIADEISIISGLLHNAVVDPADVMAMVSTALEDFGVKIVPANEDDLRELMDASDDEEDFKEHLSDLIHRRYEEDEDDSDDDVDDIFKIFGGKK